VIKAIIYDGKTACKINGELSRGSGYISINSPGASRRYDTMRIHTSEAVQHTRRWIFFEDGWACEVTSDAFSELFPDPSSGLGRKIFQVLQSDRLFLSIFFLINIALIGFLFQLGVPKLAERVASKLDNDLMIAIGNSAQKKLDSTIFSESKLSTEKQQRLKSLFKHSIGFMYLANSKYKTDIHYNVKFRDSSNKLATAFGLPNGTIIVTDKLVNILKSETHLLLMMAHSAGHIYNRHRVKATLEESLPRLIYSYLFPNSLNTRVFSSDLLKRLETLSYPAHMEKQATTLATDFMAANQIKAINLRSTIKTRVKKPYTQQHPGTIQQTKKTEENSE